ncbi:protein tyrosine phosphatase receptor type C-associated protein [Ara ararauna]
MRSRHRALTPARLSPQGAARSGPLLLALAVPAAAGDPVGTRSDRAVGALLGLLLCLAVGLALAWHHLCRLSEGRYHPSPMGRRALERLRRRWRRLRAQGDAAAQPGGEDGDAVQEGDKEEEVWRRQRPMEQQQQQQQQQEEEEEEEAEAAVGAGESPPSVGQAVGGSAEALLSELHAFSGTAAWGDAQPHVTAL